MPDGEGLGVFGEESCVKDDLDAVDKNFQQPRAVNGRRRDLRVS